MPRRRPTRNEQQQNVKTRGRSEGIVVADNRVQSTHEPSNEEKLQKEIAWCIDQLRLGLMTQKASQKQIDETVRMIKTLSSSKAPLVKKRQIMRQMFGDYRKKIADEEAKWLKDGRRKV